MTHIHLVHLADWPEGWARPFRYSILLLTNCLHDHIISTSSFSLS